MDKNTILGFLLMLGIVAVFMWWSAPDKQALEEQKRIDDSIAAAAQIAQQQKDSILLANKTEDTVQQKAVIKQTNPTEAFFSAAETVSQNDTVPTAAQPLPVLAGENETSDTTLYTLENEYLKVLISPQGAQIKKVELKGETNYRGEQLYMFGDGCDMSLQLISSNPAISRVETRDLTFAPIKDGENKLIMRYSAGEDRYLDFIYSIKPNSYLISFDIKATNLQPLLHNEMRESFVTTWNYRQKRNEKAIKGEQRYSSLYYKFVADKGVKELASAGNKQSGEIAQKIKWVAFKDQFFATAIVGNKPYETSDFTSETVSPPDFKDSDSVPDLKHYKATMWSTVEQNTDDNSLNTGFSIYTIPLKYKLLRSFNEGIVKEEDKLNFDKLLPLGWTVFRWANQYIIIPIFSWLNSFGMNLGITILLLTLIIKLIISPLTYKSYISSAKMRALKPEIDELAKKYPQKEQAMEKQQATMALYNKAGVSPMAGCVPALLQMPILIALFMFFPSAIDLRHHSFLWAPDLSTYDAVLEWDTYIPVISWAFDYHLSVLCLLMTITTILYTKFNMEMTNTGQQQMPGMKFMMYLMPIFFFFVMNNYPSGLSYYYFLSTLISVLQTIAFRFLINEDKLRAQIEANKSKPKKKSGFMARLEEAQKMQQQQMRQQAKQNVKKRK